MKLEEQVVSLEIARRLKELGVPQNSIYHWTAHNSRGGQFRIHRGKLGPFRNSLKYWSAFSLAELFELLPEQIFDPEYNSKLSLACDFWKGIKRVMYINEDSDDGCSPVIDYQDKNFPIALSKMLIHLIENKLMEVPK